MTRTIWTGVCIAIAGTATAAMTAQTPSPPQSNTSTTDRKVTVTGCLKQAPATPADNTAAGSTSTAGTAGTAGTTGTTGTSGDAAAAQPKFLLTNAAASSGDTSGAASTTGAAAAAPASETLTYRLIANPTALSPHVGKKLELIGTIEDRGATESSTGADANAPVLRVESGKIVGASCSQ
jgi:hypothetical protein